MRLDLRFVLPAALAAAALAIPAGNAAGDPPATGACPDGFMGPFLIGDVVGHDNNDNGMVCVKAANMNLVFKDDNCNPNCDQDDLLLPTAIGLEHTNPDDSRP